MKLRRRVLVLPRVLMRTTTKSAINLLSLLSTRPSELHHGKKYSTSPTVGMSTDLSITHH